MKRMLSGLVGFALLAACGCAGRGAAVAAPGGDLPVTVFIGTYTRGWACPPPPENGGACTSKGIYRARFDAKTGELGPPVLAAEAENPSYLAVSPSGEFLYAVHEIDDFEGGKGAKTGAVSAYAIEPTGNLRLVNRISSRGAEPCHVSLARSGTIALVANYTGGNVASYRIGARGELVDGSTVENPGAHGPHPNQESAHAHFVVESGVPGLVYVADLGLDKVLLYDLDATGKLTPHAAQPFVTVTPPGSGPRHLAVHPNAKFLYVNDELTTSVSVFARDPATGALTEPARQTLGTLPSSTGGRHDTGEILLSRSGRFAYVSNRGHDSITVFSVDPLTGTLAALQNVPSGGKEPRFLALDPSERFLLVANHISDEVTVFRVDPLTGKLESTGKPLAMSKPVAFAFWPKRQTR